MKESGSRGKEYIAVPSRKEKRSPVMNAFIAQPRSIEDVSRLQPIEVWVPYNQSQCSEQRPWKSQSETIPR